MPESRNVFVLTLDWTRSRGFGALALFVLEGATPAWLLARVLVRVVLVTAVAALVQLGAMMTKLGHDSPAKFETLGFWTHLKYWSHVDLLEQPDLDMRWPRRPMINDIWACHYRRHYLTIFLKHFGTWINRKVVSCHRM